MAIHQICHSSHCLPAGKEPRHILMNQARMEYYTNFIEENSVDQRRLFRAAKSLVSQPSGIDFPAKMDPLTLANEFGGYFIQKIVNIRNRLASMDCANGNSQVETSDPEVSLASFNQVSAETVQNLILNAPKKSCSLDPMPTKLVAQCIDELLPVITTMVNPNPNLSLQSGYFPKAWKEARVSPILKKNGLDMSFKNFRPVSNLSFISKLTERAVAMQIQSHKAAHSLYPPLQSAYRKYQRTETALLKVKNDILMSMNRQHVTLLVLLDLSAAFNTVDHSIMITRLQSKIGMSVCPLSWFRSYLSHRSQRVSVNGALSHKFDLHCGVPQGSCDQITVGDFNVKPVPFARNLRAWLDHKLTMSTHITQTCSSASYHLHNIRQIRKYLSWDSTENLIHAFITGRVDYCNSLLYGLPERQLNKLQRVQNAAARVIFCSSKFCHITPLFVQLHWLRVKERISFKILLITYKALHGLAPIYISELLRNKSSTNYNLRSNGERLLCPPDYKTLVTLGDRAFSAAAPKLWNALPKNIRNTATVETFKRLLKTHPFKAAF